MTCHSQFEVAHVEKLIRMMQAIVRVNFVQQTEGEKPWQQAVLCHFGTVNADFDWQQATRVKEDAE